MYNKFNIIEPDFNFYIKVINNLITNDKKIKEDNINIILNYKKDFNITWEKYDLNTFNKLDNDKIIDLINLRKKMTHEYTYNCSQLYNNILDKLNMITEKDDTVYSSSEEHILSTNPNSKI